MILVLKITRIELKNKMFYFIFPVTSCIDMLPQKPICRSQYTIKSNLLPFAKPLFNIKLNSLNFETSKQLSTELLSIKREKQSNNIQRKQAGASIHVNLCIATNNIQWLVPLFSSSFQPNSFCNSRPNCLTWMLVNVLRSHLFLLTGTQLH